MAVMAEDEHARTHAHAHCATARVQDSLRLPTRQRRERAGTLSPVVPIRSFWSEISLPCFFWSLSLLRPGRPRLAAPQAFAPAHLRLPQTPRTKWRKGSINVAWVGFRVHGAATPNAHMWARRSR